MARRTHVPAFNFNCMEGSLKGMVVTKQGEKKGKRKRVCMEVRIGHTPLLHAIVPRWCAGCNVI